jgi:squalene-hopene/tetraprenyl-beta-curcumene cyclase
MREQNMRAILTLVVLVLTNSFATAQGTHPAPTDAKSAIARGLSFLATDAIAWKKDHQCVSCHHAALVVWAMREAKDHEYAVNEPLLADLTKWLAESGDGTTSVPRPAGRPKALNTKALWFALALGADRRPDASSREGLELLLDTVRHDQTDDGSWSAWPETRPPMFGDSDEAMTALATLALQQAAAGGNQPGQEARDKAIRWLEQRTPGEDLQPIALRLILWSRLGRPSDERTALLSRIKQRQNQDGGWGQAPGMSSDAWATGQALYALSEAGERPDDQAIARGRAFLVGSQRADGSWPMASRPTKPGGEGAKSLVPITGAGSAWGVLGLVRSQPSK